MAHEFKAEIDMVDHIEPLKPQTYMREGLCILNGPVPVAVIKVSPYNKHEILVYINESVVNVDLLYEMAETKGVSNAVELMALLGLKHAIQTIEEQGIDSFEQAVELLLNQIINAFSIPQFINYVENAFDKGLVQAVPYRLTVYKEKVSLVDREGVFKVCNSAIPFRSKDGKDEFSEIENRFIKLNNILFDNSSVLTSILQIAGINPMQLISNENFLIKEAIVIPKIADMLANLEVRYF